MYEVTSIGDRVLAAIELWAPSEPHEKELQYRDDLLRYLWGKFPDEDIRKERHLADISVGNAVVVEVKNHLMKKAELDRLQGQILDYFDDGYLYAIIVVCGTIDDSLKHALIYKIKKLDSVVKNKGRLSIFNFVRLVDKTGI